MLERDGKEGEEWQTEDDGKRRRDGGRKRKVKDTDHIEGRGQEKVMEVKRREDLTYDMIQTNTHNYFLLYLPAYLSGCLLLKHTHTSTNKRIHTDKGEDVKLGIFHALGGTF